MTTIDTILYANGALRLSRHGARHGGNVLTHIESGAVCAISDSQIAAVDRHLSRSARAFAEQDFNYVSAHLADPTRAERTYGGKRHKVVDHLIVPAFAQQGV